MSQVWLLAIATCLMAQTTHLSGQVASLDSQRNSARREAAASSALMVRPQQVHMGHTELPQDREMDRRALAYFVTMARVLAPAPRAMSMSLTTSP